MDKTLHDELVDRDMPLTFERELQALLNKYSRQNASCNTPDFILADYLLGCLETFDKAMRQREQWRGYAFNLYESGVIKDCV